MPLPLVPCFRGWLDPVRRFAFKSSVAIACLVAWGGLHMPLTRLHALPVNQSKARSIALPTTPAISSNAIPRPDEAPIEPAVDPIDNQVRIADQLRADGHYAAAADTYGRILRAHASPEIKRSVLLQLGMVFHENNQLSKAQQVLAQFVQEYPRDHALPEVLLRQGLIYREMGAQNMAITKFYAVMTAALSLKVDQFESYQQLVLQAQTAISDTYFDLGQYREAADFFSRLIKQDPSTSNQPRLRFRLICSLAHLNRHPEIIAHSNSFLRDHPDSPDIAQVRFLLAAALQAQGRDPEALQQILLLLQSQHAQAHDEPEAWHYWQRRAGNALANTFYLQGDYINALTLYQRLAEFDPAPAWQLPIYYQIGLIFERLEQTDQAVASYQRILARKQEPTSSHQPSLELLLQLTRWRIDQLDWRRQARTGLLSLHHEETFNPPLTQ
jgi:tetratricopeptide (TPR) repeat protein